MRHTSSVWRRKSAKKCLLGDVIVNMRDRFANLALVNVSVQALVLKLMSEFMNESFRVERKKKLHLDVDA